MLLRDWNSARESFGDSPMIIEPVKRLVEKAFKCRIYRNSLPRGTDLFFDLDRAFGLKNVRTVFDVGANAGQSSVPYVQQFPNASIYAFEPVAGIFEQLKQATGNSPRVHAFCCGMGREPGASSIHVNAEYSTISSICNARPGDIEQAIKLDSIDHFCGEHQIKLIDFMKIDTEGYELEVLAGAVQMLERQAIRLMMIECDPIGTNKVFVSYQSLLDFLGKYGYQLFGIYGQSRYWDGRRAMEYFNPLFICRTLAESNLEPIAPDANAIG
jgi:FkbM family methyltransferase